MKHFGADLRYFAEINVGDPLKSLHSKFLNNGFDHFARLDAVRLDLLNIGEQKGCGVIIFLYDDVSLESVSGSNGAHQTLKAAIIEKELHHLRINSLEGGIQRPGFKSKKDSWEEGG